MVLQYTRAISTDSLCYKISFCLSILFQKFDKCFEDSHAANKDETLCMPLVSIIKNLTHLSDGLVVLLSLVRQFDAFRSCLAKRQLANSFMKDLGGGGRAWGLTSSAFWTWNTCSVYVMFDVFLNYYGRCAHMCLWWVKRFPCNPDKGCVRTYRWLVQFDWLVDLGGRLGCPQQHSRTFPKQCTTSL